MGACFTATGVKQAEYEYDVFGKTTGKYGSKSDDFAFTFSTKYLDKETNLYYYGYRYYSPSTGRWPSKDPMQERGGVNLYGVLGNNTISKTDKLGLMENGNNWDKYFVDNLTYVYVPPQFSERDTCMD